jgi:hypothetical protein
MAEPNAGGRGPGSGPDPDAVPGPREAGAPSAAADGGTGPAFEEVQRFRGRWTLAGTGAVSAACVLGAVAFRPGSAGAAVLVGTAVLVPLAVAVAALRIEVRDDGVRVRLFPLHLRARTVRFREVTGVERVSVAALEDYGGVGIRRDGDSWAYLVGSGDGVRLERAGRPDVVLVSPRAGELYRAAEAGWRRVHGDAGRGGR